jgi:hypothetical protein
MECPSRPTVCLILAVLTTYTLASVNSKVTKTSPRWVDTMSRVEEGKHVPGTAVSLCTAAAPAACILDFSEGQGSGFSLRS